MLPACTMLISSAYFFAFQMGSCDMRFALAGGQRVEAYAGGRGTCRRCNGEVIAKCGTHRVAHWAHRGMRDCDTWAEKETDWHRAWKNNFPAECQEFIQHDGQSGEKHVADVRTPHGLVFEFQHSHLDPLERAARRRRLSADTVESSTFTSGQAGPMQDLYPRPEGTPVCKLGVDLPRPTPPSLAAFRQAASNEVVSWGETVGGRTPRGTRKPRQLSSAS